MTSSLESPRPIIDDLPSFSLSPLPYITEVVHGLASVSVHYLELFPWQVGDYLLTLPQRLEPFSSQDNPGLMVALKVGYLPGQSHEGPGRHVCKCVSTIALRPMSHHTHLFCITVEGNEEHMSGVWLEAIAKATVDLYIHSILHIPLVINHTAQQLAADIGNPGNLNTHLWGIHLSFGLPPIRILYKCSGSTWPCS